MSQGICFEISYVQQLEVLATNCELDLHEVGAAQPAIHIHRKGSADTEVA